MTVMRTGITPDGRTLNAEWMPWEVYARLSDRELTAIWLLIETMAR
jgi:hypothetical protein